MVAGTVTKLKQRDLWALQDPVAVHAGKIFPYLCVSAWLWKFSDKSVHHIKLINGCTDPRHWRDRQSPKHRQQ